VTNATVSLAYQEIRLIISHLLWNFDLELSDPGSKNWTDQTSHWVWVKKPLLVRLSPRKVVQVACVVRGQGSGERAVIRMTSDRGLAKNKATTCSKATVRGVATMLC
jgi:hypothetical protein